MRFLLIISLILAAAAIGWFVGSRTGGQPAVQETPAEVDAGTLRPTLIRAQGKIQPAGGLLKIVAPPGERIAAMTGKRVGDQVVKDEILVTLASRDIRQRDLDLAHARRDDALEELGYEQRQGKLKLTTAQLALDEANSSDQKIAQQAQAIGLLEGQAEVARKLLERLQRLSTDVATQALVSQSDIEKQQLLVDQLGLQIQHAQAEVRIARESAARMQESAASNLQVAQSAVDNAAEKVPTKSLSAAVALAEKAFELTQIRAPCDATIVDIIVHPNDTVTNQPIMMLADVSQMNCEVEVVDLYLKQIDLARYKGLRAKISGLALPEPIFGTVVSKGRMLGPISLESPNPFAKSDQRIGVVTVRLDKPAVAANFINLQVDVEIEPEPGVLEAGRENQSR